MKYMRVLAVLGLFWISGCGSSKSHQAQSTNDIPEMLKGISLTEVITMSFLCGVRVESVAEDHRRDPNSKSATELGCKDIESFVRAKVPLVP